MSDKVTKESVKYQQSHSILKSCGTCGMYRIGGTCTHVQGKINARDVCDDWDFWKSGDS